MKIKWGEEGEKKKHVRTKQMLTGCSFSTNTASHFTPMPYPLLAFGTKIHIQNMLQQTHS